jgi:hypothetical protein
MRYIDFRDAVRTELRRHTAGLTWTQLRERRHLPYKNPCQTWVNRLEQEIGLVRVPGQGRSLVWKVGPRTGRPAKRKRVARAACSE